MKKLLIITFALTLLTGSVFAVENTSTQRTAFDKQSQFERKMPPSKEQIEQHRKAKEAAFEQKLGLTEVQKLKARELRKAGFDKIKPVMEELKTNKIEAKKIQQAQDLTVKQKEEKLSVIDKNIADLEKKASVIRKQNMKDFESILTKNQKKILKQMKKDGRKNFQKENKGRIVPPPCPPHRLEIK